MSIGLNMLVESELRFNFIINFTIYNLSKCDSLTFSIFLSNFSNNTKITNLLNLLILQDINFLFSQNL